MEIEDKVHDFWLKVEHEYLELTKIGGVAESMDFYLFQTSYYFNPDLMIVGINPGGDASNGSSWICPPDNQNMYIVGDHQWFKTLRNIFGYPNNQILKEYLENCVGSNRVFINTGNVNKIPNSDVLGPTFIRELVSEIIKPKHIVALGKDVFYSLSNRKESHITFGNHNFVYSFRNNIPICYIPNPSRRNNRYFNNQEKLEDWQKALEWFLTSTFES